MLGSTASVFLDHVSRDWGDVTVVLVELRWTPRKFHISPTAAIGSSHFPVGIAVRTLLFGRIFAMFEDLGVVHVGDQVLRFFAELVDLLRLSQVCGSRTSRSTSRLCSRVLYSAARLQKEVLQIFCGPRCRCRFHRNFSNRLMVPKMILRLGFVDLADHIASSIAARLVALSELSEPSGRAHPEFSYVQLSQCKLQAVYCRERLHVTAFGKIASLSLWRASNCTKIQYFDGVS